MSATAPLYDPTRPLRDLLDRQFGRMQGRSEGEEVPFRLWEAALYGPLAEYLARPGKEFRARLVRAAWQLGGGRGAIPEELPLLVEILHAASLIIDDIEDGSAYRRGGPALHCVMGTPLAINAGNWMYFWPEVALEAMALPPSVELQLRRTISRTLLACHEGQALDLSVRVTELARGEVAGVVRATTVRKTGSLFELAASMGATASGAALGPREAIQRFGRELGVGLQMLDDLSGLTNEQRCHKGHEDLLLERPTWPWAWLAEDLDDADYDAMIDLGRRVARRDAHPEIMARRIRHALGDSGKARIRGQLARTLSDLEAEVGPSAVLGSLKQEIAMLEDSYV